MHAQGDKNALRFAGIGTALAGLVLVACAVGVAILCTTGQRPSLDAQPIINAGRMLAEQLWR